MLVTAKHQIIVSLWNDVPLNMQTRLLFVSIEWWPLIDGQWWVADCENWYGNNRSHCPYGHMNVEERVFTFYTQLKRSIITCNQKFTMLYSRIYIGG